jgi:hypothetical protein
MKFADRLKFYMTWLYRICHLLISGLLLGSVISLYVYSGDFTSLHSVRFSEIAIMLLITGFFALAFVPGFIYWVYKPLRHRRGGDPAPEITTPRPVTVFNIIFALILIFAGSSTISMYLEKGARSNVIMAFSVADEATRCIENYILSNDGRLPRNIPETGFEYRKNSRISSIDYNAENTSLKLVFKEFYKVKAGASLTFIRRDQGWDCFSDGIPKIHLMQKKCPEQVKNTK